MSPQHEQWAGSAAESHWTMRETFPGLIQMYSEKQAAQPTTGILLNCSNLSKPTIQLSSPTAETTRVSHLVQTLYFVPQSRQDCTELHHSSITVPGVVFTEQYRATTVPSQNLVPEQYRATHSPISTEGTGQSHTSVPLYLSTDRTVSQSPHSTWCSIYRSHRKVTSLYLFPQY